MKDIGIIRKKIIDLTKEFGFDDFYFTNSAKDACTTLLLFKKYLPSNIDQSNDKASISQYYICSNKSYFSAKTLCDYVNKELGIGAGVNREIKLKNRASNYGGIIGLNSLYYHDTFGSFVVMRAIDLGITLTLSKKSACKQCNKCMACAKACPTGAIDENGYHIEKCLRNMLNGDIPFEHRSKLSQLIGCDLCQTACPMNTKERVDPTSFYLDDLLSNKETKKLKVLCGSNFASKTRIVTQSLCIAVNKQHHDSLKTIKQLLNDDIQKVRYYAEWAYENLYKTK